MPIATRMLRIKAGRLDREVAVALLAPEPGPSGGWFCSYSIAWPEEPRRGEGWDVDAVQALHLTLGRIGLDL